MHPIILQQENIAISQVAIYLLLPFVAVFSFIIFIFYRQNREGQLRKQKVELELKALRAQMNPHFMFNCLSSIYQTMKQQKNDEAGEYLLKFSHLLRRVLENSGKRWISLQEDLEILRNYLDLEQMRTGHKFTYTLNTSSDLDLENTSGLMLIAQPFVENSIWHAFASDSENAHLKVEITNLENQLRYLIEDNGTNADAKTVLGETGKRISLGTSLVRDQLTAVKMLEKVEVDLQIEDLFNATGNYCGRRVTMVLPLLSLH